MDLINLWPLIGIPIVRSASGWAENALKDGAISTFEWQQLGSTVLRVGLIGAATFFGLNEFGIDATAFGSASAAFIMDFILMALKNKK